MLPKLDAYAAEDFENAAITLESVVKNGLLPVVQALRECAEEMRKTESGLVAITCSQQNVGVALYTLLGASAIKEAAGEDELSAGILTGAQLCRDVYELLERSKLEPKE